MKRTTAVLSKIPHYNNSKSVPNRPLRGRGGRFGTLLGQLECGVFGRTAVQCKRAKRRQRMGADVSAIMSMMEPLWRQRGSKRLNDCQILQLFCWLTRGNYCDQLHPWKRESTHFHCSRKNNKQRAFGGTGVRGGCLHPLRSLTAPVVFDARPRSTTDAAAVVVARHACCTAGSAETRTADAPHERQMLCCSGLFI